MTPSARIQATIELWQKLNNAHTPMDNICSDYFRSRRFIGSKDRSDIAERTYTMMRTYARLCWWCTRTGMDGNSRSLALLFLVLSEGKKIADINALCNGQKYSPDPLSDTEHQILSAIEGQFLNHKDMPDIVLVECPKHHERVLRGLYGDDFIHEMQAMLNPAPLDIRVNTLKSTVENVRLSLTEQDVQFEMCTYSPVGLRLISRTSLSKTTAFTKGWIEIQDEGSQLLALICSAKPGMQVLDYCAGGGGKTLALAAAMENKGRIVAMDIDQRRLDKGKVRFARAGIHNIEVRPSKDEKHKKWFRRQKETFDIVLVDVPCTSSGTWRRNPDLRWKNNNLDQEKIMKAQTDILEQVKYTVKKGGRLVYATCSLFPEENEQQVNRFLENNPDFRIVPAKEAWNQAGLLPQKCPVNADDVFLRLSPFRHQTDGFFAAILQKI